MMDSKLTSKLNKEVIERAKKLAAEKKISLSRLVENYLDSITRPSREEIEISPFVKSIATGESVPVDLDDGQIREEYREFLRQKYR